MGEPDAAAGPITFSDEDLDYLAKRLAGHLLGCNTSRRSDGQVSWLLDAAAIVTLMELGAELATRYETPGVFDQAAHLLGWTPDADFLMPS